jgi:5-methyltetrahydropteroyltriglutamate--homocysteine methyltransferase
MVDSIDYPIIDDIGSIPLPAYAREEDFKEMYWDLYKAIISGANWDELMLHRGFKSTIIRPIIDSFQLKINCGIEIPTYSRHWDMHTPFLFPIENYAIQPYHIDNTKARIIEVDILREYAKHHFEETGIKTQCRVSVTGALELYLKLKGFAVYKDIALNLARSINSFFKKAIYSDRYFETPVIAIDEPSIGIITFNLISDDDIVDILEKESSGLNQEIQIHLHSLAKSEIALNCKNIDVLTCEYASRTDQKIPKKLLEKYDKFMRVGITRTNISNLIADQIEVGIPPKHFANDEGLISIIDSKNRIKKRYKEAIKYYGDRLRYVGPDCGLIGWQSHKVVSALLSRTVSAVKELR